MALKFLPALTVVVLLSSCAAFKPLNFTSSKQVATIAPSVSAPSKFIDNISVTAPSSGQKTQMRTEPKVTAVIAPERGVNIVEKANTASDKEIKDILAASNRSANSNSTSIENATAVQFKYAVLLKTEMENLPSKTLLDAVDEWYGVRYRRGGNTKGGIDCSGFTEAVFLKAYGMQIPAVAREQYRVCRKISTSELEEGDLVFFNTTGGVSHVGVYLGNDRFIHATVHGGVMVNALNESYYVKRYIGAGRIEGKQLLAKD